LHLFADISIQPPVDENMSALVIVLISLGSIVALATLAAVVWAGYLYLSHSQSLTILGRQLIGRRTEVDLLAFSELAVIDGHTSVS
jgi:hypothetical protein